MWKANDEQLGFRPSLLDSFFELSKEAFAGSEGNTTKVAAGENYRVLMDRIGWTGAKYYVTRIYDGPRQVGQPFLGADGDDRLAVRVEIYLVAPLVPIADGNAELVNAS
jgi:hypothetical protein